MIPSRLMTLEKLGLPETVRELLFKPRGLVLVTGPTGSGKSTTLASMLDVINKERGVHIITIEDPIEFYHTSKKSLVTQREVGADVPSFSEAIRRALRQDPDVILIGEMRDLETMQAAITAAETGHLVFATLHTTGASTTVDRIVDAFPTEQQAQVRTQLSVGLNAVISQLLLKRIDKPGRVAAFEIMFSTPSIRSRIRDNKTFMIDSDIQTGSKFGMISLDTHLLNLYTAGVISYDDLITKSKDPDTLVQKLKEMQGGGR
jgi:twitching motility protein PilT